METHTEPTDYELVQAALDNPEEFRKLYRKYSEGVYRFVRYRVNTSMDAEDIVSDVFFKVLKKLKTYDPQYAFSTWIYRIARNAVIDFYRKRKIDVDIEQIAEIAETVEPQGERVDVKMHVEHIMKQLNKDERILLTMRYVDDMAYKDIAKATGKSEASLRTTFSRIKKVVQQ